MSRLIRPLYRRLCTVHDASQSVPPPKSILEQNQERARQYIQKYSLKLAPAFAHPIKKNIPIVTGSPPDPPTLAARLEEEHGAVDVTTVDVRKKAPFTDWLIVCCGKTERHVLAIADGIKHDLRKAQVRVGGELVAVCGRDDAEWMAVDVGGIVVHVMTEEARERYDLEGLWKEYVELQGEGDEEMILDTEKQN